MIVVPTLNPGFLLRSGEDDAGLAKLGVAVQEDFRKAKRLIHSTPGWDERVIWETDSVGRLRWLFPDLTDVSDFMGPVIKYAMDGRFCPLVFDVETSGEHQLDCKLLCVGMGYVDLDESSRLGRRVERVISLPLLRRGGAPYWSPHDEMLVRECLKTLLSTPWIEKCCHNGAFDTVVMWAHGIPVNGWTQDTMQAHHVCDAELPQNLGFVGSRFTDNRYWKDDVKNGDGWLDMDELILRSYNARDVLVTLRVLPSLLAEIDELGLKNLYRQELRLAQIMARATIRGMAVDYERRDSEALDANGKPVGLAPQLRLQQAAALANLRAIAGSTFDPAKPAQLRWLLFDKLKLPVVKETATGLPATDKEALMLLDIAADSGEQRMVLKSLTEFRQAQKFLGTFIEGLGVLNKTGRFHPSWKLLPVTGRFGSSPNAQNLPTRIKRIFRAAAGYKLVGIDLSQAELRLIAYYANEKSLLDMYANDINVHTVNASMLFKVRCPPEAADNINEATEDYLRRAVVESLGLKPGAYDAFPVVPKKKWRPTRTLAKNYEFGSAYGAEEETLYKVLRSKRDPDTSELMFPGITLSEVQALRVVWKKLRPGVISWWERISNATRNTGYYKCPISGRVRRFRGGFKRNEMLNTPIQSGVASWMNQNMIEIQDVYDAETGGAAQIVQQVHDALTVECPEEYAVRAGQVMQELLSREFSIEPFSGFEGAIGRHARARLPADTPAIADHLDKT